MPLSDSSRVSGFSVRDLPELLRQVAAARHLLADVRHTAHAADAETLAARNGLLAALEAYADALASTGRPVPYRIRDELNMYRRLRTAYPPRRRPGLSPRPDGPVGR